jgi:Mg-chelatase subunit ChlD
MLALCMVMVMGIHADTMTDTDDKPIVEVVFVLDTTGSMSAMLHTAKDKIWSIATSLSQSTVAPEIRMGLVAYRDRGDKYVTKIVDLSTDMDDVYSKLIAFKSRGGGDAPESVNQALYEAVEDISWSKSPDAYKVIFLVGDQPPHMNYSNDIPYMASCKRANKKGIMMNTIQMGAVLSTEEIWRDIASRVNGEYIRVDRRANGLQIETPYDADIATFSDMLEAERIYYGSQREQEVSYDRIAKSKAMSRKLSSSIKARRSSYNFSKSGKKNLYGSKELVEDLATNKIKLESLDTKRLPKQMQAMNKKEQKVYIAKMSKKRKELKAKILALQKKRKSYIAKKVDKKRIKGSFSYKIYNTIKKQAKKRNIIYKEKVLN